jgi:diguanylate cyclase (GGDEF)-like protein
MCKINKFNLKKTEADRIYENVLDEGNLEVSKWDINSGDIFISEKIAGHNFDRAESKTEFISESYEEDKIIDLYDNLTEFPNRTFFYEILNNSLKKAKANNKKGALIYIDLDNFKHINDNLGHHSGDLILKLFSQLVNTLIEECGELARLGGDEFAILIHEFKNIEQIEEICNKIHEYLENPFEIIENQIYITASLGITVFPDDSSDADELLKFCDFAMYKSKHKGKNMHTFFNKQIADNYFRKILIENELKSSINNNELYVLYQPQIDALSNEVIGTEALLRWNNKKLGNVSPSEFIPIAENTGYIVKIGNWVLDRALRMAYLWKEKGYKFNTISVNISPIQIKRADFKENLLNACARYNVPPCLLEMEITEGTLIEICKEKIKVLNELIESGVHIAIDDFGTGYSSLNYLINLPVNTLKIDKLFLDNIENEKNRAVIKCIVDLSKSLKYEVIAEGVETEEQMNLITGLGCNIIQGYYFSKPLSENEIDDFFKK